MMSGIALTRRIFKPSWTSRNSLRSYLPAVQARPLRQLATGQEEGKQKVLQRLAQSLTKDYVDVTSELKSAHKAHLFTDDERDFIKDKLLTMDEKNLETSIEELELPEFLRPIVIGDVAETAPTEDEKELEVDEFVKYLVEQLYSFVEDEKLVDLKDFELYLSAAKQKPTTINVFPELHKDAATAINSIINDADCPTVEQNLLSIHAMCSSEERRLGFGNFRPPLNKLAVNIYFRKYRGNEKALREVLDTRLYPVERGDFGIGETTGRDSLPADLSYVTVDGDDVFSTADVHPDKRYAIVVAGECGSGKTKFAIGKALEQGFLPVYCAIPSLSPNPSALEPQLDQELRKKPTPTHPSLSSFLELVTLCFGEVHKCDKKVESLYALKGKLYKERDAWATRVLDATMQGAVCGGIDGQMWINGQMWLDGYWSTQVLPKKVAVIIDEAWDIDLVEGLVSTVRINTSRYLGRLAQKEFLLVLVANGLDVIKVAGRAGTTPSHSELISMKNPNMENLVKEGKVSAEVLQAINEGSFARVLSTNARTFFLAVEPMLTRSIHEVDDLDMDPSVKKLPLGDRLVKVASSQRLMDDAAGIVSRNSVHEFAEGERDDLVKNAFLYHLKCAVEEVKCDEVKRRETERMTSWAIDEDIFTYGLANRKGTSTALKYLSCFGLSCEVRPGFGDDFEELAVLHVMCLMDSEEYEVFRCQLKYAWPPQMSSEAAYAEQIEKLRDVVLPEQEDEELFEKLPGDATRYCIVFDQDMAIAQAGVLLVLKVDEEEGYAKLDIIQRKNCKKHATKDDIVSWWSSLGVAIGTEDTEPVDESAGYSYCGLEAFCKLVSRRLDMDVQIDSRILAVSYECPATFQLPKDKKLRWWFREMLEPTISVLPPRSPSEDENED